MNYIEFIRSEKFKEFYKYIDILPIKISSDSEYIVRLKEVFSKYTNELNKIDFNKINVSVKLKRVEDICKIIIESINYQLSGNSIEAINSVKKLFDDKDIGKDLFSCILEEEESNNFTKQLYRGRVGENIFELSEMFHVPFNKRQYVAAGRYSIPGYPCLYLSGSIYGCWLELNKPQVNNLYISRFEIKRKLELLDLSLLPREIFNGNLGNGNEYTNRIINGDPVSLSSIIEKYIYTWPIICACSFIVNENNRTFKSEYILSQLLLQVIRNISDDRDKVHFDGIKYFSVKCDYDQNVKPEPLYVNYVFISENKNKYIDETKNEYSKNLIDSFKLTPPSNAYMCMSLNESARSGIKNISYNNNMVDIRPDGLRMRAKIEIFKGYPIEYQGTDFYELERLLCTVCAKDIE